MIATDIRSGDPYFNRISSGGYSPCILGNYPKNANRRTGLPGTDVLPNCVGMVVGMFNRLGNYGECKWLGSWNAKDFFANAKKQGLEAGAEPKEGSVICWTGGKGGTGHVGIVTEVFDDGITVTQSGWSAGRTWSAKHYKGENGQWTDGEDSSWMKGWYAFQGFIYHPDYVGEEEMTYDQFKEYMQRYEQERADLPAASWAEDAMNKAKEDGVITGSGDGNLRPQSYMTRQEYAVIRLKENK